MSDPLETLSSCLRLRGVSHELHDDHIVISQTGRYFTTYTIAMWNADPSVPVMYLNVLIEDTDSEGNVMIRPALVEEVLDRQITTPEFAPWLSVTDHPITSLPTLYIHPCRTQEWIKQMGTNSLELWLQYFGQGVGLELSPS